MSTAGFIKVELKSSGIVKPEYLPPKIFLRTPFNSSQLGEILDIISRNLPLRTQLWKNSRRQKKVKDEKYSTNTSYGNINRSLYSAQ